jgi:putative transposase
MVGPDSVFAKLFQNTINAVLQAEMENHLGYGNNQKAGISKVSGNSRNGYNSKKIKSQYGEIEIEIPRDRVAAFEPQIVAKQQTTTNDLEAQILALYAMGNSTNEISQHFKQIYGFDISDNYISTVTEKVLPLVKEWLSRPLQPIYPIVFLDAIRYKVREGGGNNGLGGKIMDKAVHIALGIGIDGKKDVLGLYISENESAKFWMSVLSDVKSRGVQDILIASTDNLTGFTDAIHSIFPNTKHQKCIIHQIRNSTKFVSYKDLKQFTSDLKLVYTSKDENTALDQFEMFKNKWNKDYAYAIKSWETNWPELMTYMEYPQEIRKLIYTTNPIEGLNRQLRKVTSKRTVYPSDEAVLKNLYLVITKLNDKWTMPVRDWSKILNQLTILFEDRIIRFINH